MRNDGKNYENYVNKFVKGEIVSSKCKYYDIESKTTLYEVKGTKILQENLKSTSLGRYQIKFKNHRRFNEEGKKKNKKVKYIFVLRVKRQKMFKTLNWETVNRIMLLEGKMCKKKDGVKLCNINLRYVW